MGLVSIMITDSDCRQLTDGSVDVNLLFNRLFFDTNNHQRILTELNNYHSDEDGAPVVSEFEIAGDTYHSDTLTGQVRLAYHVDFTFACADRRATTHHFETSDFTINPDCKTLSLLIHDKISRDTYEEF